MSKYSDLLQHDKKQAEQINSREKSNVFVEELQKIRNIQIFHNLSPEQLRVELIKNHKSLLTTSILAKNGKHHLTPELINNMKKRRMDTELISKLFNKSVSWTYKITHTSKTEGGHYPNPLLPLILEKKRSGESLRGIAKQIGKSKTYVNKLFREYKEKPCTP